MYWKTIDKSGARLYKGMAILMISTHNFMHVFPLPRQNEFAFKRDYFDSFLYLMWNEPENSFRVVASYFGHFGVQIFIFLSAYGLTKKYFNKTIKYKEFIWTRLIKIYPTFLLAIITWFIFRFFWYSFNGTLETADFMLDAILLKIIGVSNFIPGYALKPVGPWWFFPFIIQFYLIYPFIIKSVNIWNEKSLFIISVISLATVILLQDVNVNFFYSILPYMPCFCIGIFMAKYDCKGLSISNYYILVTLIIFILGNIYKPFWFVSHFTALFLLITLFQVLKSAIEKINILTRFFLFAGKISMHIFFVNGFIRTPLIEWAMADGIWYRVIYYFSIYLILTIIISFVLFKIEFRLRYFYNRCF